jgi:ParB-like chromosome segregation protein Spo0J
MKHEIVMRDVETLIPYARNARTHSPVQISQIINSIKEFGFTAPVLTHGNGILAGHGRVQAARSLGMVQVPTIDLSHLTKTQARAYILADNQLALNAGWEAEMLSLELVELKDEGFDLDLLGFDDLAGLMGGDAPPVPPAPGKDGYKKQYGVIVICSGEEHQESIFNQLQGLGMECRVVVT